MRACCALTRRGSHGEDSSSCQRELPGRTKQLHLKRSSSSEPTTTTDTRANLISLSNTSSSKEGPQKDRRGVEADEESGGEEATKKKKEALCESCGTHCMEDTRESSSLDVFGTSKLTREQKRLLLHPVELGEELTEVEDDEEENTSKRKKTEGGEAEKKSGKKKKRKECSWNWFYTDIRAWNLSALVCFSVQLALCCFLQLVKRKEEEEKEERKKLERGRGSVGLAVKDDRAAGEEFECREKGALLKREGRDLRLREKKKKKLFSESKRLRMVARLALRHAAR